MSAVQAGAPMTAQSESLGSLCCAPVCGELSRIEAVLTSLWQKYSRRRRIKLAFARLEFAVELADPRAEFFGIDDPVKVLENECDGFAFI